MPRWSPVSTMSWMSPSASSRELVILQPINWVARKRAALPWVWGWIESWFMGNSCLRVGEALRVVEGTGRTTPRVQERILVERPEAGVKWQ